MKVNSNIQIFIVVIVILFGFYLLFRTKPKYNKVPKKIWTYWDNPDKLPKTVKMCMDSWKKHNPAYEITLLTKKNYFNWINIPIEIAQHPNFNDSPARFSDLIRLYALAEHGGVWIDSSILLKAPLDDWLFPKYAEFSGFYLDSYTKEGLPPVIESWFLASNKNSNFMRLWCEEFTKIAKYTSVESYVLSRKEMGVDFEKITEPLYLAILIAAQKVLQIDTYSLDSLILKKAEDGPFKYLVEAKWNSEKALQLACMNQNYQTPIMKMRVLERDILEKEIDYNLSPERCGWLN
jgi:Capsular polysaccharide synthesis protein